MVGSISDVGQNKPTNRNRQNDEIEEIEIDSGIYRSHENDNDDVDIDIDIDDEDIEEEIIISDFATISSGIHNAQMSPDFIVWCPTVDMIAFSPLQTPEQLKSQPLNSTTDTHTSPKSVPTGISFFRLSSQQVWSWASSISTKKNLTAIQPLAIAWHEDGRSFAAILRDGSCKVYNCSRGKHLYTIHQAPNSLNNPPIDNSSTTVGEKTFIPEIIPKSIVGNTTKTNDGLWTAISWSTYRFSESLINATPFLKLASTCNPLKSLPKMSFQNPAQLPADSKYVMRNVMEEIIHSKLIDIDSFEMTMQLCGNNKGEVDLSIYGAFDVGRFQLDKDCAAVVSIVPFKKTPQTVMILTKKQSEDIMKETYKLYTVNIDFIRRFGLYLLDVTIIPTQISAILEYLRAEVDGFKVEIKNMTAAQRTFYKELIAYVVKTEHKSKDPAFIQQELERQQQHPDTVQLMPFLVDALVTGFPEEEIDYWVSQGIRERGIRKWRKEILHGYENIRRKLFIYIMPACERLIANLGHLRGLSQWTERGAPLNLDSQLLGLAVEQATRLTIETNDFLWALNAEFLLFRSYANWIDLIYESVTKQSMRENPTEGPRLAHTLKVSDYINKYIPTVCEPYPFGRDHKKHPDNDDNNTNKEEENDTRANVNGLEPESVDNTPGIETLFENLNSTCNKILGKIKTNFLQNIKVCGPPKVITTEANTVVRIRNISEGKKNHQSSNTFDFSDITKGEEELTSYIVMYNEKINKSELVFAKIDVQQTLSSSSSSCIPSTTKNGVGREGGYAAKFQDKRINKSVVEICRVDVSLGDPNARVAQFDFIDDEDLMVLVTSPENTSKEEVNTNDNSSKLESATVLSMSYFDLMYTVAAYNNNNNNNEENLTNNNNGELSSLYKLACESIEESIPVNIKKSRRFSRNPDEDNTNTQGVDKKDKEIKKRKEEGGGGEQNGNSNIIDNDGKPQIIYNEFEDADDEEKRVEMIEQDFVPGSFAVNGNAGRRVGCLLEEDGHRYIFFDLDGEEYEERVIDVFEDETENQTENGNEYENGNEDGDVYQSQYYEYVVGEDNEDKENEDEKGEIIDS